MDISHFPRARRVQAKRAFTTRRVPARDMQTLLSGNLTPASGDLVLATVHELGKHRKIERVNGRRALMMPGDEIIVCYGNRYAPDQFEAMVSDDLGLCDLVASGGIAAREINRHDRMLPPTRIRPIGLIGNRHGQALNLADFRIRLDCAAAPIKVVMVVGTAMNAGKTFTAASVVRGLKECGHRVAGIKATGTGSGGDLWKMKDMGADLVLDFTDAGFSSTYKVPDASIEAGVLGLIGHASRRRCSYAVVEIADGLQHQETATLLRSGKLQARVAATVFAAYDSLGARAGYRELCELGYPPLAISGQLTRSPLAMRETVGATDCAIYTPYEIQAGALMPMLTGDGSDPQAEAHEEMQRKLADPSRFVVDFESRHGDSVRRRLAEDRHSLEFPDDLGETA